MSFINTEDLREHIQTEHIDNPINCKICSKVFLCRDKFNEHKGKEHKDSNPSQWSQTDDEIIVKGK